MNNLIKKLVIFTLLAGLAFGGGIFLAERKIHTSRVLSENNIIIQNEKEQVSTPTQEPSPQASQPATEEPASPSDVQDQDPLPAPVKEQSSFSFAILGDTQLFNPEDANGGLQKAVRFINTKNVSFVMTEGDLLFSCGGKAGCEGKLNQWKSALGSLYSKTYALMGNHDRTGRDKADALWQRFFNLPNNGPAGFQELTYSFDVENVHIVVLNSEKPDEHVVNKTQRDWLESDLVKNTREHTFIFFHEPAYPVSSKQEESLDVEKNDRDALWQILERHKVEAVFNGHEHINSRRKIGSIYQFGFGNTDSFDHDLPKAGVAEYSYRGQNFGVVTVSSTTVKVEVYSVDGKLLNSFELKK
jgi:hypothetical protein